MIPFQHWNDWDEIIPVVEMILAQETSRHAMRGTGRCVLSATDGRW